MGIRSGGGTPGIATRPRARWGDYHSCEILLSRAGGASIRPVLTRGREKSRALCSANLPEGCVETRPAYDDSSAVPAPDGTSSRRSARKDDESWDLDKIPRFSLGGWAHRLLTGRSP